MKYTLHMHTVGFDGRNTIGEMVNRARELGFNTVGISNHFIVNPIIKNTKMYKYSEYGGYNNIYSSDFDEVLARFIPHYDELNRVADENSDIKILRGIEADFFPDPKWRDGFEHAIRVLKPDYIIGASHFIEYNGTLLNSHDWKNADPKTQDILLKRYWDKVAIAGQSGLFDFMAHIDLPKKAGLGHAEKWAEYENRAIESVARAGGAVEINTSFYRSYCYEPYPSNRILKMMSQLNIPTIISDDAHEIKNIGRHFDEARQLIQKFNLKIYTK